MSRSTTAEGTLTGRRTFRSSGAFTVPDGVYSLRALLVGGGGGAGGPAASSTQPQYGGPGGGGWPFIFDVPVMPGDSVTIVVGSGGSAGVKSANGNTGTFGTPGGQGGDTMLFANGVLAAVAQGGGYGGGGQNTSTAGASGSSGNDSLLSGGSPGINGGGPGGGYCGGVQSVNETQRIRFGRRTRGRQANFAYGGTNGGGFDQALTANADVYSQIESMLLQPLRLQYGAGGLQTNAATPANPPANTGQGGDGGPVGGTSTPGASGLAQIEWEVTAA